VHLAHSASYLGTDLAARYRLERLIGEGASSWVFAGTDLRLDRDIAVKLLKPRAEPEHSAQRVRFVHEGRTLAKLAHPHVVAVHDAGETPAGHGYLVMELSHAGTLEAELCRRSTLGLEETLQLVLPLLGALACAHDRGIIHRDLKPANIALIQHEGGSRRAKLLDFGIAKPSGQATSSGGLAGTPAYMAPEQARAEPLGPGADVWAMGVVLFRCLSGRLPFEASSSAAMLLKLVQGRAVSIAGACPGLPSRVALTIDQALEPDAFHRYPDMRTFARVLGIACRQDGVRVDVNPEPIGLPEFGAWLERADIETTRRKDLTSGSSPVIAAEASAASSAPVAERAALPLIDCATPRRARRRAALWTGAALAALLLALWGMIGQPVPTRGQSSPSVSSARVQAPLQPDPAVEPQVVHPAPVEVLVPAPAALVAPRRPMQRGKQPAHPLKQSAGAIDVTPSEIGVGGEHAQPGLVTNWDW
jgi:serine/threonine protein kinase